MKTIVTKYHYATDHRGERVIASDRDGNHFTLNVYGCASLDFDKHGEAAQALCAKMGWDGPMIGGHTKDGMVWVFDDERSPRIGFDAKPTLLQACEMVLASLEHNLSPEFLPETRECLRNAISQAKGVKSNG